MTATATGVDSREIPGVGRLDFEESERSRAYWFLPEGGKRRTRLPSVTGIISGTWPKPGLLEWYLKHGGDAPRLRDESAERGKRVHSFIESYMRDDLRPFSDFPTDTWAFLKGASQFLVDYDPIPIESELLVCHPEFSYAGRLDLIADIAGVTTLLDFKTNPEGRIYPEAHVQTTAYAIAHERCGGVEIAQTLLVGINAEGGYNAVPGADATKTWAVTRDFYSQIQRFKRELNGGKS